MNNLYLGFGIACITWYTTATLAGWEYGDPRRFHRPQPSGTRAGPGGPIIFHRPGYSTGRGPGSSSGSYGFLGGK